MAGALSRIQGVEKVSYPFFKCHFHIYWGFIQVLYTYSIQLIVYSFHIVTFSWGFNFSVCTVYKRNRTSYMGDVTGQRITPELQKVGLTTVNQFGNLNIIEPI